MESDKFKGLFACTGCILLLVFKYGRLQARLKYRFKDDHCPLLAILLLGLGVAIFNVVKYNPYERIPEQLCRIKNRSF